MKPTETEKQFAKIITALRRRSGVTLGGPKKKGFGAGALCVNEKIFAMVSSKGNLVMKLPRERVDALVAAGSGTRFGPGHGRVMKEWLTVDSGADVDRLALAEEALAFVAKGK